MMLYPGAKHPAGPQLTPRRLSPQRSTAAADSAGSDDDQHSSNNSHSSSSSSFSHHALPPSDPTNSPSALAALNRKRGDYLTALAIMRPKVLDYDVHSCSSYSASYLPENIKVNNPQDQSSRWSSGSNNQMQYIMIKLKKMAIAHTITFGKYHKVHVCNLKEFKVYGGLTSSNMTELLHTGLRNDHEPETFLLKHKTNTVVFPCQYIKIVPLMAWGANFNFSVWFVEMKGIDDPELVQETYFQYINFRETESVRLCLKHFRQRKLTEAFRELQQRTQIALEDPLLTELYQELVIKGNFKRAEELMVEAADRKMFDEYSKNYDYKPIWRRLWPKRRNGYHHQHQHHHHLHLHPHPDEGPRQRGGHQMCIDTKGGFVYLMGGWDGTRDLADFWAYHIPSQEWILISPDTTIQGGPSARSCHKVCYSAQHNAIFLLGRYVDPDNRSKTDLTSDFWRFDIDPNAAPYGRWSKICSNTAAMNGPDLIYDHQMCLDPFSQTLYVFGGKVVHADKNVQHYSGLYSYHISTGKWRLLRADGSSPAIQDKGVVLRSRIGHSMLYDEVLRGLVIFAGQMNKDYLSDFYVYDIATDRVIEVCKDYNKQGGPEAGFTQRSTISSRGREIYVLSGLVKDRALGAEQVKNSFWVFKLPGQNQMDAIRDVQLALTQSKVTGSIGTLKSIMNLGATTSQTTYSTSMDGGNFGILSMQQNQHPTAMGHANTHHSESPQGGRPSASRRRIHEDLNDGDHMEATTSINAPSRRGATARSSALSASLPSQTAVGASPVSSRVSQTSSLSKSADGRMATSPTLTGHAPRRGSTSTAPPPVTNVTSSNTAFSTRPSVISIQEASSTLHNSPGIGSVPLNVNSRGEVDRSMATSTAHPMNGYHGSSSSSSTNHMGMGKMMPSNDAAPMEPLSLAYVLSDQGSWKKIFQNSTPDLSERGEQEPVPRYAHQLVYDDVNEVQYLFGGNPGEQGNMSKRLDDFWELRLYKPSPEHILRKARYLLRTQQFKELCQRPETCVLTSTTVMTDELATEESKRKRMIRKKLRWQRAAMRGFVNDGDERHSSTLIQRGTEAHLEQSRRALNFLQTELSGVVDHANKTENEEFRLLIRGLLLGGFGRSSSSLSTSPTMSHMTMFAPLGDATSGGGGGMPPVIAGSQYAGLAQPATASQSMFGHSSSFHPPKTTVKLASTPAMSPNMSACPRLMLSPNPGTGGPCSFSPRRSSSSVVSGTTFLTSPKSSPMQSSRFFSLSHLGVAPRQQYRHHPDAPEAGAASGSGGSIDGEEDLVMTAATSGLARDKDETDGVVPRDPNNATPEDVEDVEDVEDKVDMGRHQDKGGLGHTTVAAIDASGSDTINDLHDDDNHDDHDDTDDSDDGSANIEEEEGEGEEWIEGLDEEQDRVMRACMRDRIILYENLLEFFAEEMKQPKGDLIDLVKIG